MSLLALAGCGGGVGSGAKAGLIVVAVSGGTSGTANSLAIGTAMQLSMTPTGDKLNAGVDWGVTCGGSPITGSITGGACGTLAPAHTAGGAVTTFTAPSIIPLGTTVTITASVTSNSSQTSSITFPILTLPIAVQILVNNQAASIEESTTVNFDAQVKNDLKNAGVVWTVSCGSSACGSFKPTIPPSNTATAYTAPSTIPAGGTVTVTATSVTDSTKSASATIAITAPPAVVPISISISPSTFYVATSGTARTQHPMAFVLNDSANKGVDWTLTCATSNCGAITSHTNSGTQTNFINSSTVPAGGTISLTATSTADSTKFATVIATVVAAPPIVVTISPMPPASLAVEAQTSLAASTGTTDPNNLGLNWSASCSSAGACGSFSLSPAHTASGGTITYTAPATVPAGNVVTITASSPATTPANSANARTTIVVKPPVVSFTQSPTATLTAGTRTPVSATVANDVSPGGVTWTVQCNNTLPGGCGAVVPYQTPSGGTANYTAPPVTSTGTTVTIKASSTAAPTSSINSTPIAITPDTRLSVNFIPAPPSQMQTNATVSLNAAVSHDSTSAGVDWQVCASGCGFFTVTPATPAIPATTTTTYVPAVPAVMATTVSAWPNGRAIPYTAPSQVPASGTVGVLVTAHADPTVSTSAAVLISPAANAPGLNGIVQSGTQPVVGALVTLYAAGTSGYGAASSVLSNSGSASTAVTNSNGSFTMPAGYECPQPNSQIYLVATGGRVGANDPNNNLALMTALGSCSSVGSSVVVNEVTTVGSAWAVAPFAANDALTGNSSYLYIGTSSGNVAGLMNAFAAVNNLVDITTGQARFTVPAGNAVVPYAEINTLADTLNACTATSGGVEGDGSACGMLFTATDLLGTGTFNASIAPFDTLQAAFNIAQHPAEGSNYGYDLDPNSNLLTLAARSSPFQPILTNQPNDWSISLNYTGGGGLSPASTVSSFALDSTGNLWITDTKAGAAIEWNAIGAALSPATGFPAGGGPIAVDVSGNIWVSGDSSLTELTNLGTPYPGSPFAGVTGGGNDLAIDAQSNLWITTGAGVAAFNSLGMGLSPLTGYVNDGVVGTLPVAIDSSNNVWVGNGQNGGVYQLAELTNPGGQLVVITDDLSSSAVMSQVAADGSGDIWSPAAGIGGLCKVPPYAGTGTILFPACSAGGGSGGGTGALPILNPQGIALDGAGTVWVASAGGTASNTVVPNVASVMPGLVGNTPAFMSTSLAAGPLRLAVDGAGNVWVLLSNNTVTEYVGLATPVVTPIALGVKNKKLGAKP